LDEGIDGENAKIRMGFGVVPEENPTGQLMRLSA
jgi:hypothetical protein